MLPTSRLPTDSTAAYTDLNSLQKIKSEGNSDAALHKVAKQFESMFVNMLFKGMRQSNAVFEEGNMGHSNAETMYRDMHDQQMSLNISQGRGMGIAAMVYGQLKRNSQVGKESSGELDGTLMHRPDKFRVSNNPALSVNKIQYDDAINATAEVNEGAPSIATKNSSSKEAGETFAPNSPEEFVQTLMPIAKNVASKMGLDPLMMVAQAALETGWGKHMVKAAGGENANNLFNIKADSRWQGKSVGTPTLEYKDGIAVRENAKFRRYDTIADSVNDFAHFIETHPRYEHAIKHSSDGEKFIEELHRAGYATDPFYADKVKAVYQKVQTLQFGPLFNNSEGDIDTLLPEDVDTSALSTGSRS